MVSQAPPPAQPLPLSGWYPDPARTDQERYWDGTGWTTQTRPLSTAAPTSPAVSSLPQPQPASVPAAAYQDPYRPRSGPMTDDRVPLAGWWARGGALLIDMIIVAVVTAVAAIPYYDTLSTAFQRLYEDTWRAAQTGGVAPDPYDPAYGLVDVMGTISLIMAAVGFVYATGMQIWRSATLGMLALGLRVVPIGRGQQHNGLPMGTALIRNLVYQLLSIFSITAVINYLLPLANARRQTLHDMIARTQVVKIR